MKNNISSYYKERHKFGYVEELSDEKGNPENHGFYISLKNFIEKYELKKKKCLEIGSGRGMFQDIVKDYTATDICGSKS